MLNRVLSTIILNCFLLNTISFQVFAQSPADLGLPAPGVMLHASTTYTPLMVRGLKVHPENPFLLDFIVDTGNSQIKVDSSELNNKAQEQIKYFLAALTVPAKDLWVNLSPYEGNRIAPESLGQTLLGRDMLAQDYLLKQMTASLVYPEKELGRKFWNDVYSKVRRKYGDAQVPMNAFNKVWVVADKAKVFVKNNTVVVVDSHIKVMLEEDYVAQVANNISESPYQSLRHLAKQSPQGASPSGALPLRADGTISENNIKQITSEIILPALEREVNEGKNFAPLRQMYQALILAAWYKKELKQSLLNQIYVNQAKVNGVNVDDPTIKDQIYQQYLKAYKKGVFNLIKEDGTADRQARKYFAGGVVGQVAPEVVSEQEARAKVGKTGDLAMVTVNAVPDTAMISNELNKSASDLGAVVSHVMKQLLDGKNETTHLIPTFMGNNPTLQDGWTIGVDASGSTLREVAIEINDGKVVRMIANDPLKWDDGGYKQSGDIFALMAERIGQLRQKAIEAGMPAKISLRVGLSFAFPTNQTSLTEATITGLPKGWQGRAGDYMGKNPAALLQYAIDVKGLDVRVKALMNDTTATQLNVPGAIMAMILGTGFNISVIDPEIQQIVNSESGGVNIPDFVLTEADRKFIEFMKSQGQWTHQYERFITSESLAQLIRIHLKEVNGFGSVFQAKLDDPDNFKGKNNKGVERFILISQIEQFGEHNNWKEVRSLLGQMFNMQDEVAQAILNDKETTMVYKMIKSLTNRSARLVAASIVANASLADVHKQILSTQGYVIPVDGSVFWKYHQMKERITQQMRILLGEGVGFYYHHGDLNRIPKLANRITFVYVDTASARGAAISVSDNAMQVSTQKPIKRLDYGGIDFNSDRLKLSQSGEIINWQFNQAMLVSLKEGNFTGLVPRIVKITALNSFLPILGLTP